MPGKELIENHIAVEDMRIDMASAIPGVAAAAEPIAKAAVEFLDRDVLSYHREHSVVKVSENGRRETIEKSDVTLGVKVWEIVAGLGLVALWEMMQIFKEDVTQLQSSGAWIDVALAEIAFGPFGAAAAAAAESTPPTLPPTNGMSAMAILDAQVGLAIANIGGALNANGQSILNLLFQGLSSQNGAPGTGPGFPFGGPGGTARP